MLAFQNNAAVGFDLPGLSTSVEPVATATAKFDLSLSLGEQRGADGTPAGIDGVLEYATDLFDRAERGGAGGPAGASAGGGGCGARSGDRAASTFSRRRSATPSCASGTTPRIRSRPPPCRSCSPPRRREPPMPSRWCSRTTSLTYARARCARQPAGASSAEASGSAPRSWSGCASSARSRWWSGCSASSRPAAPICRSIPPIPPSASPSCSRMPALRVLVTQAALLDRLPRMRCPDRAARRRLARHRPAARRPLRASPSSRTTPPTSSTPQDRPERRRASRSHMAAFANLVGSPDRSLRHRDEDRVLQIASLELRCCDLGDL